VQAVGWQARRAARLAELGFQDLAGYLKARRVEQAGRSSGRGPSLGLAAAGWLGSWPGWGCDPDLVWFSALLPCFIDSNPGQGDQQMGAGAPRDSDCELTIDGRVEALVDPHVRVRFLICLRA
jgi:hypothetical protein